MRLLLLAAALCLSPLAAHADTITVYNASGVFKSGLALTGTLTLDETTGVFTEANVVIGNMFPYVRVNQYYDIDPGVALVDLHPFGTAGTPALGLFFATSSFIDYQGGSIGSETMPAGIQTSLITYHAGQPDILQYGSLTPAQTPEPSSIALLGTGLVGMFGAVRRKYMSA